MKAGDAKKAAESKQAGAVTMTSAVLEKPGEWRIDHSEALMPQKGEIRVRLEGCGVCASGIPVWQGREWFEYPYPPGKLGHEGWGVVDAVGEEAGEEDEDSRELKVGDRVAFLADGSYSTHLCLPAEQALVLPDSLAGKPFPAEPVGCAVNIIERCDIHPGGTALIIGMGFLGCLLLQLVKHAGGRAICVSERPTSRRVADRLGALATFPFEEPWQVKEGLGKMGYASFSRVIEATGAEKGLEIASELVGERGRLIIAGYHQDGPRQVNLQQWNWKGIDVINAHERAPSRYTAGMSKAITLASVGAIDLDPLLTHRYPLRDINKAYRDLVDRPEGFMKGWIDLSYEAL